MPGNERVLLLKTLFEAFLTRCVGKRDVLGHPRRKLISGFVLAVSILFALADTTVSKYIQTSGQICKAAGPYNRLKALDR